MYIPLPNPFTGDLQLVNDTSVIFHVKDPVDTYTDLPITGNGENDLRCIKDADTLWTWSIASSSGALTDWKMIGSTSSVLWANVVNRPSSAVADIDDAVNKRHSANTDTYLSTQVTQVIYVDCNRTDIYTPNGSITKPYKSIPEAYTALSDADINNRYVLKLANGTYSDGFWFKPYIFLNGESKEGVIVTGGTEFENVGGIIEITDLTINATINWSAPKDGWAKIEVRNVDFDGGFWNTQGSAAGVNGQLILEDVVCKNGYYFGSFSCFTSYKFTNVIANDILLFSENADVYFTNSRLLGTFTLHSYVINTPAIRLYAYSNIAIGATWDCQGTNTLYIDNGSAYGATVTGAGNIVYIESTGSLPVMPVTKTLQVDKNRLDIYVEDGSIWRPYKSITAALASITPTINNPYLINIAPGKYEEKVTMKSFVTLDGGSSTSVDIFKTDDDALVASTPMTGAGKLINLTVYTTSANTSHAGINISGSGYLNTQNIMVSAETGTALAMSGNGQIFAWATECLGAINGATLTDTSSLFVYGGCAFGGGGSPNWDLATAAGTYLQIDGSSTFYNDRKNLLGTTKLSTLASIVKNDSSVTGVSVKDALDNLNAISTALPATKTTYVDGGRVDSYTATGTILKPFKTIQAALTALTGTRNVIKVLAGTYTETLNFTYSEYLFIDLIGAVIVGDVTWNSAASAVYKAKLVIRGADLRTYPGYPINGIQGNFNFIQTATTSRYSALHLVNTGILGNIVCTNTLSNSAILTHIFMTNAVYTGDLTSDGKITAILYADNSNRSGSASIGGASGAVVPYQLTNIEITRPWLINATIGGGGGGTWYNIIWKTGSNFSSMKGTVKADANSYASYYANVSPKGIETIVLMDEARGVKNDSTVAGTSVKDALDTLATMGTHTHTNLTELNKITKINWSAAVDPVVGNDSSQGYGIGSTWINTSTNKEFVCTNANVGAAIWIERTNIKSNITTSDPTVNDDSGDLYVIGSRWINTTTDEEFVCTDNTLGAAVWVSTTTLHDMEDHRYFHQDSIVGLQFNYYGGRVRNDTTVTTFPDGFVTAINGTNYVEVDATAVYINQVGFTSGRIPLYTLVAAGGAITTVTDKRTWASIGSGGSGSTNHAILTNLDYASAAHTGFEPTVTKGNLTAGTGISIGGTGTGAVIGGGASVTNTDTGTAARTAHELAYNHSNIHSQNTDTGTTGLSFAIGAGTDVDIDLIAQNADVNKPKIRYNKTSNKWTYTNDGTTYIEFSAGGGIPGGSNKQVQFNDSSVFGGDSGFTYDKVTKSITVTGTTKAKLDLGSDDSGLARIYRAQLGRTLAIQNRVKTWGDVYTPYAIKFDRIPTGYGSAIVPLNTNEGSFETWVDFGANWEATDYSDGLIDGKASGNNFINLGRFLNIGIPVIQGYYDGQGYGYFVRYVVPSGTTGMHQVQFTWSVTNSRLELYFDEELVDSLDQVLTPIVGVINTLYFGYSTSWTWKSRAIMDEARIYNYPISSAKVGIDYNGGYGQKGVDETGLLAGYHFDEGAGAIAYDYSHYHRNMDLTSYYTWEAGWVGSSISTVFASLVTSEDLPNIKDVEGKVTFGHGLGYTDISGQRISLKGSVINSTRSVTVSETILESDNIILADDTAGDITMTLPFATADIIGKKIIIYKTNTSANRVYFVAASGDSILGGGGSIGDQGQGMSRICIAENIWINGI